MAELLLHVPLLRHSDQMYYHIMMQYDVKAHGFHGRGLMVDISLRMICIFFLIQPQNTGALPTIISQW